MKERGTQAQVNGTDETEVGPAQHSVPTRSFEPRPGDVLASKYRVEEVLGRGGMGMVVVGTDLSLERRVAIKFLLPHSSQDKGSIARFIREARAAAKIQSEHVARVHEVGTLPEGAPYIVMELLDGVDLGTLLKQKGRLPVGEAADCVLQALEALAEAHSAGIVHRDLKPSNLFLHRLLDGTTTVKVLDFGISKKVDSTELTSRWALLGTPMYMSPEQLQAPREVDARTDVWSLGVVLYQLVVGELPFSADSLPAVCLRIVRGAYEPISSSRPQVPEAFQSVVERCLKVDPAERFQSVAELAKALEPLAPEYARVSSLRAQRLAAVGEATHELPSREVAEPDKHDVSPKQTSGLGRWEKSPQALAIASSADEIPASRTSRLLGVGALALAGVGLLYAALNQTWPGAAVEARPAASLSPTVHESLRSGAAASEQARDGGLSKVRWRSCEPAR